MSPRMSNEDVAEILAERRSVGSTTGREARRLPTLEIGE